MINENHLMSDQRQNLIRREVEGKETLLEVLGSSFLGFASWQTGWQACSSLLS